MDGQELYERHREDMLGYDLPVPHWRDLTPTAKRGWEAAADDYVAKRLADEREEPHE